MNTHTICLYGELKKVILELSSVTHLISFSASEASSGFVLVFSDDCPCFIFLQKLLSGSFQC